MILRNVTSAALLALVTLAAGCASEATEASEETGTSEDAVTGTSVQYFRVVGRDYRKCAYPMCGGYYVARVNFAQTKCIDGSWQDRCYVSDIDLGKLELPPAQAEKELGEAQAGHVVLKARFAKKQLTSTLSATILQASEGWQAASQSEPTGTFYKVDDSGIVCITSPCPTIHEAKLNSSVSKNVTGLDLSGAGLNDKQIAGVFASLDQGGVIVAGKNVVHPKAGPAGDGTDLVASAVYQKIVPDHGFCLSDVECTMTPYTKPVASKSDCYCTMCGDATDTTSATANQADYKATCAGVKMMCPMVKCMYREAKCIENRCTAVAPSAPLSAPQPLRASRGTPSPVAPRERRGSSSLFRAVRVVRAAPCRAGFSRLVSCCSPRARRRRRRRPTRRRSRHRPRRPP